MGEVPSSPVDSRELTHFPFAWLRDSYGEQRIARDAVAHVVGETGSRPTFFWPLRCARVFRSYLGRSDIP